MKSTLKILFKHKGRIAIVVAIIIYFVLSYANDIQEKQFQQDLEKLDINKDGIYSDTEVTKEEKEIIEKMQKRLNRYCAFYINSFCRFLRIIYLFWFKSS